MYSRCAGIDGELCSSPPAHPWPTSPTTLSSMAMIDKWIQEPGVDRLETITLVRSQKPGAISDA